MLNNMTVRYFIHSEHLEEDEALFETDERGFTDAVELGAKIKYERHTIRENGVSQIILTADQNS